MTIATSGAKPHGLVLQILPVAVVGKRLAATSKFAVISQAMNFGRSAGYQAAVGKRLASTKGFAIISQSMNMGR